MKRIKKYLFKIKLKLIHQSNKLYRRTHQKQLTKSISIISCRKWQNKVKEDLILVRHLLHLGIDANIIAWEDGLPNTKNAIIRSIWGYQKNHEEFIKYLNDMQKNNITLFNDYEIINNNFDKSKQIKILRNSNTPHIQTEIIYDEKSLQKHLKRQTPLVIKPVISASGDNTFLINSKQKGNINQDKLLAKVAKYIKDGLLVQPFIKEIENGEYSVIILNGHISHGVIRFPAIFTKRSGTFYLSHNQIEPNLLKLIDHITKNIDEYKQHLYMRIDAVRIKQKYYIMEIELFEPQLFLEWIPNKKIKNQTYKAFAEEIKKRLK